MADEWFEGPRGWLKPFPRVWTQSSNANVLVTRVRRQKGEKMAACNSWKL